MPGLLIHPYLVELSKLRQVSGTHRASVDSEAVKDLLKGRARSKDLAFESGFERQKGAYRVEKLRSKNPREKIWPQECDCRKISVLDHIQRDARGQAHEKGSP